MDKTNETYKISLLTRDSKQYLLRFRENLRQLVNTAKYPFQIGIALELKTNNNGFPSSEENLNLFRLEDFLLSSLEVPDKAVYAGTITGGGIKEFVFYTGTPKGIEKLFPKIKNWEKTYDLQLNIQEDKDWSVYETLCPRS